MVNPFYKNLRLRTFAAVMLLNFFVILLISIFFQQRSLSFFEREFADTLYEQAKGRIQDLISIIHVFSYRIYGLRKYRGKLKGDETVAQILQDRTSAHRKPKG